ncbi:MAG: hypothetical protein E7291_01535 [Lachnospiraceae bacterium]|nr:hypothetical protein [Lachnospiraceae bacterium]
MSRYRSVMAAGLCMLMLTGCGSVALPESIEKNTLSISEEGQITSYLVESFDKDYYDVSELTTMAVEDAAAYNADAQAGDSIPITVEEVEMLGTGADVMITYRYSAGEIYEKHREAVLFYGTVTEALEAGYSMEAVSLSSVKDQTLITEAWMKTEAADKHILITDQQAEIYLPYKVTHISAGVVSNENGSVDTTQTEGRSYILMKK